MISAFRSRGDWGRPNTVSISRQSGGGHERFSFQRPPIVRSASSAGESRRLSPVNPWFLGLSPESPPGYRRLLPPSAYIVRCPDESGASPRSLHRSDDLSRPLNFSRFQRRPRRASRRPRERGSTPLLSQKRTPGGGSAYRESEWLNT